MIPRLKSSLKWTPLPAELCGQIREVFEENFQEAAKKGQFLIEGRIYSAELCFRAGYLEKGRLLQANFEVSLEFDAKKQNALQLIQTGVDCAASMMQQYFTPTENSEVEEDPLEAFPRQWQEHAFDGIKLYLQVSTVNSSLEEEANRLLGEGVDNLVRGEDPEEDERAVISMLGLEDDSVTTPEDDTDANESDDSETKH